MSSCVARSLLSCVARRHFFSCRKKTFLIVPQEDASSCVTRRHFFLRHKKNFLPVSQEASSSRVTRRHNDKVTSSCNGTLQCSCACTGWPARAVQFDINPGFSAQSMRCSCSHVLVVMFVLYITIWALLLKISFDLKSGFLSNM